MLKKSLDNTVWLPIIIGYNLPYVSETLKSVNSTIFFWALLYSFNLFNFELDDTMKDFLLFLSKELYNYYCIQQGEYQESSAQILPLFWEISNSRESSGWLKDYSMKLTDFVAAVIERCTTHPDETPSYSAKQILPNASQIYSTEFLVNLESHIMKTQSQHQILLDILRAGILSLVEQSELLDLKLEIFDDYAMKDNERFLELINERLPEVGELYFNETNPLGDAHELRLGIFFFKMFNCSKTKNCTLVTIWRFNRLWNLPSVGSSNVCARSQSSNLLLLFGSLQARKGV